MVNLGFLYALAVAVTALAAPSSASNSLVASLDARAPKACTNPANLLQNPSFESSKISEWHPSTKISYAIHLDSRSHERCMAKHLKARGSIMPTTRKSPLRRLWMEATRATMRYRLLVLPSCRMTRRSAKWSKTSRPARLAATSFRGPCTLPKMQHKELIIALLGWQFGLHVQEVLPKSLTLPSDPMCSRVMSQTPGRAANRRSTNG